MSREDPVKRRARQARYRANMRRDVAKALILWDADDLEHRAGPIRTVELRTFPRLDDQEMAALFGLMFAGYVS